MKVLLPIYRPLFFLLFTTAFSQAFSQQASTYTFSTSTASFNYLPADGISLKTGVSSWDDNVFTNVPIGFTFYFEGKPYQSVGVSSNGFIWFGSGSVNTTEYNPISDATLGTGTINGVIAAYGTNLVAFPSTMTMAETGSPEISYATTGSACSQVFTVQWKGAYATNDPGYEGTGSGSFSSSSGDDNRIDLQIELNQTTNEISILISTYPYPYSAPSTGQVGVRGAANSDFSSLEVTNTCGIFDLHPYWSVSAQTTNNATVCTNQPCYASPNASYNFTPAACPFTVTTNSTNAGCGADGSITLTTTGGTGPFTYTAKNTGVTDSNQTGMFTGLGQGTYCIAVTNGTCAVGTSATLTSSSSTATATNSGTACIGGNVTILTPTISGAVYHWTGPNGFTSSQQNPVISNITVADTGIYTIIDSIGGCGTEPGTTDVSINGSISPPVVTASKTEMCNNDSAQLCVTTNFAHYQWNTVNQGYPADTGKCIFVYQAGNYYVAVTDQNGCTATSDENGNPAINITIYPVTSVSIVVQGDTLASFGQPNYQWYLNGSPINGATTSTYVAQTPGYYAVEVTDSNGCQNLSQGVQTAIQNLTNDVGFEIFPNPATTNSILLSISTECLGCTIEMYDVDGRLVYSGKVKSQKQDIDISQLAKGTYMIDVSGSVKKFIKQ